MAAEFVLPSPSLRGPAVRKSELDKREYRLITLSNGLRCLLIAEEDLGAAAGELDRSTSSSSTPRKQYNHRPRENLKPASGMDDVELMDYDSALDSDYVPTDSSSAGGSSASECSDSASEMSVDDSSQGSDSESDGEGDSDEGDSSAPARKAAAAMAVNVGHWSDPDDISGLAHFCEHMLFFSNAKYPQENGWETYLSAHGGSSNASTDAEQTIYQFDVHPTYLDDALDRFAQFFISPLFSSDAIDREILAVDSEFNISLQNDSHRLHEVQNCTAASRHPFAKFGWGNTKSLVTDVKAKGIDIREALLKFHSTYYSANAMCLVVLGEDLDHLQRVVEQCFTPICNTGRPLLSFAACGSPFDQTSLGHVFEVASVRDSYSVDVSWALPPLLSEYATKPAEYYGNLIGHEGEGSLLSRLKALGWSTGLSVGVSKSGQDSSTAAWIMSASIALTPLGYQNWERVVDHLFCFIHLVRRCGPQPYLWDELKVVADTEFRFQDKVEAVDYVEELALSMHFFSSQPEDILVGDFLYEKYDPQSLIRVMDHMTADKCRIFLSSRQALANYNPADCEVEPWFGTAFRRSPFPAGALQRWCNPQLRDDRLTLPPPNQFLPTDFSLCSHSDSLPVPVFASAAEAALPWLYPPPQRIHNDAFGSVWHKADHLFKQPRAFLYLSFETPVACRSPIDCVRLALLCMLLKEELNEYVYPATLAGLSFNVQALRSGLEVKVSGFSQKLRMLALSVVERAVKFTPNEDVFQIQMERLARFYTSMHFEAGTLGESIRLVIQQSTRFPLVLLRAALPDVSFSSVIALRQELFSALWLNVFAHGNIQANQALDLYHAVRFIVSWQAVPQALQFSDRCVNLPEKCNFVFAQPGCNPDDNNSYVESFFQVGIDTFELRTMLHFLSYICYEPCFDQLRTRDQLGYNVGCCQRNTSGILGFGVQVISALQSPAFIDQRIESFLADFSKTLRQLSAKEFADHVQSYITQKEPDHNLEDEAARYWDEICDKTYVFDRPAREAKYIREHVTQASLSAFYDQHIAPLPNSQRRKLGLWVFAAGRELSSSAMSIDTNAVVPPHWPVSGPAFPLLPSETLDPQTGIAGGAESEFGGAKRIVDWVQFKRSLPLFPDLSS